MAILARTRRRDGKRVIRSDCVTPVAVSTPVASIHDGKHNSLNLVQKVDQAGCGWIDPQVVRTPFDQVAQRWLDVGDNKRPRSIGRDKAVVNGHLLPVFKDRPVPSITSKQVQILVNKWSKTHAASMMARMFSVLRAIMNFAVDAEMIQRSPCRRIRLPQAYPRTAPILDGETMETRPTALGDCGPMVYLAVQGLRWGEIAGLRVRDLDLLRHRVVIERQRTRGRGARWWNSTQKRKLLSGL